MLRIGLDAMGGDFAPDVVVKGALEASRELPQGSVIVLFGDREQIEKKLCENGSPANAFEIVHTTETIGMNEHPAQSFVKKTDSSVVVGFRHLQEGQIDGFASAGNTGAMLVGSMTTVGQIDGIIRPAISAQIAASNGKSFLLLDVGLNVGCKPEVLYQYAVIGNAYAQNVMKLEKPRVALLNIGEEKEKGNMATKAAYELMEQTEQFEFTGNIESKYIFTGQFADVVVCDGFVGNLVLKQAEGFYEIAKASGVKDEYIDRLNYEIVGGTPVLGINGNVMVGHGCSSPFAIKNMILQTEKTIKGRLVKKLCEIFN
ncbi:MAG: phosphate acyltransferase PlsX [Rikenellaceae bacterium]|nr:phosphate acyltransferase PlsX [Rikenellaceae bacterium]